jgi:hypothetical protein
MEEAFDFLRGFVVGLSPGDLGMVGLSAIFRSKYLEFSRRT